nr:class I SAM-dependent methyltransferase [Paenibacillus sp. YN15]
MTHTNHRIKLRDTFEQAAMRYQQARPDYPEELFDSLIRATRLHPDDRLLEIGCATGKATLPLAHRGYRITAIELGRNLAKQARHNLAETNATVIHANFEDWEPAFSEERYGLIYAATAWRWIDPKVRYQRAWDWLRPGGHLAFWNAEHVFPADGDPFFREIQEVYAELGEGRPVEDNDWTRPGEQRDERSVTDHGIKWCPPFQFRNGGFGMFAFFDVPADAWYRDELSRLVQAGPDQWPDGRQLWARCSDQPSGNRRNPDSFIFRSMERCRQQRSQRQRPG